MRATLISRINRLKTITAEKADKVLEELSLAERQYETDPSPDKASHLKLQSRVVNQLQYKMSRRKLFFSLDRNSLKMEREWESY